MTDFERRSVISGIGQSDVGRRLGRTGLDLTIDAALEAIADAGLTVADIDGIATYPGAGLARHVLVYRTVTESTAQGGGGRQGIGLGGSSRAPRMGGFLQWNIPF